MFDSDGYTPIGEKLFAMFAKLNEVTEMELMQFTAEELRLLRLSYGEALVYPIYGQIDQVLDGATESETVH